MLVRLFLAGVLVSTLAASTASPPSDVTVPFVEPTASVMLVKATHTVRVEYRSRSGAMRQARITIRPLERGARAEWARSLHAVFFSTPRTTPGLSRYTLADRIIEVEREGDGFVGTGLVPAPEYLHVFLLRNAEGTTGFTVQDAPGDSEDPPGDDPPKDPPSDDPPEDEEECSCAGCMEICDPWTCECSDPNPFPEVEGVRSDGSGVSFGI